MGVSCKSRRVCSVVGLKTVNAPVEMAEEMSGREPTFCCSKEDSGAKAGFHARRATTSANAGILRSAQNDKL